MKHALFGAAAAFMLAFSGPVSAGDKITPKEAEKKIYEGCVEDKDATVEECQCVVKSLKSELPKKEYDKLINIVVFAMNGEISGLWDFVVKNGLTLSELKKLGEELDEASDRIEKICGGRHINLELNI
ncbi:hypothetical protein KFE96_07240 [Kordiimonas sp. SCSIO 12603]|uniref:hypothetical protein n=1 Tax=Kordiimonas sp. SCSIO 12603 TaxID=2829596 RepID=UPI002101F863|nr:hypothetical protein [Kordiimonas sp. SCSIO 12603]UTW60096.1 hypothetical protein KFE96_07240 [Kordiimonas sp. SCSIO 12603]